MKKILLIAAVAMMSVACCSKGEKKECCKEGEQKECCKEGECKKECCKDADKKCCDASKACCKEAEKQCCQQAAETETLKEEIAEEEALIKAE